MAFLAKLKRGSRSTAPPSHSSPPGEESARLSPTTFLGCLPIKNAMRAYHRTLTWNLERVRIARLRRRRLGDLCPSPSPGAARSTIDSETIVAARITACAVRCRDVMIVMGRTYRNDFVRHHINFGVDSSPSMVPP